MIPQPGTPGTFAEQVITQPGTFGTPVESSSEVPVGSGSNFQKLPFSTDETEAIMLLIEGGEMGKT